MAMIEQEPYRAYIPPVPEDAPRPLWSVMIPTYNSGAYLFETLASILTQDPGPDLMQIEVVDDCSTTDDPGAAIAAIAKGRVRLYRQPRNVGHVENFATCLRRSRGRLIHLLHGDDCVRDGFYSKMQESFSENPQIGAGFCRQIFMDENGHWQGISPLEQKHSGLLDNRLERLALEQRIMTPSIVVRRKVYETLGGFDRRLVCSEDWEMWVRIAARYPIWYEVEPLALYRMHLHSNTGRHIRNAGDISYTRKAIDLFKYHLPAEMAERVSRQAKHTYALSALETAYGSAATGDFTAARAQIFAALRCSHSFAVLRKLVQHVTRFVMPLLRST